MSDTRLRELEKRWIASGSVGDEAAWLNLRRQRGSLDPEQLDLSAYLGHPAARALLPDAGAFPDDLDDLLIQWGRALGARLAAAAGTSYLASLDAEERADWRTRLDAVLADLEACAEGIPAQESKAAKDAIYHGAGRAGPLRTLHHAVIRFDWPEWEAVIADRDRAESLGMGFAPKVSTTGPNALAQSLRSLSNRVGPEFLDRLRAEVVSWALKREPEHEGGEAHDAILRRAETGGRGLLERILAGEVKQAAVMLASLLGDANAREAVKAGGGAPPKRGPTLDFASLEAFDADYALTACLWASLALAELPRVAAARADQEGRRQARDRGGEARSRLFGPRHARTGAARGTGREEGLHEDR
ncbi:MAG: hypothetical protein JKY65_31650 [Planctomycetes bacterium]|nr:hypothetical protein [Planctomycetota bacterium]